MQFADKISHFTSDLYNGTHLAMLKKPYLIKACCQIVEF
jgi:hypothetical protein